MASSSSTSKSKDRCFSGIEPPPPVTRRKVSESTPILYDVFINHRGPDSKDDLARPLYKSLEKLGIRAFLDEEELELGQSFPPAIETAISSAAVHIAIFSKRYAESPWCLAELVLMLQTQALIIPVFYQVKPSDLHHIEKGGYADAFNYYLNKSRYLEKLDEWKEALQSISRIKGLLMENFSASKCERIVTKVQMEVQRTKPLLVADHPVALDKLVRDFERRCLNKRVQQFELHRGMNEGEGRSEIVGVYGMGGVGKTTLCKELFNRMLRKYDRACFLYDVREASARSKIPSLQEKLLKDLFGVKKRSFLSIEEGSNSIFDHVKRSISLSFLIVLDDISHREQLDAFMIMDMLKKPGDSLVIISTRDVGVLKRARIEVRYHLEGMDQNDSRELFSLHAFSQSHPATGYEDLVDNFLGVCGGLPLSLKVLGRHVHNHDLSYWKIALDKYGETLHGDIKQILKISFDALETEEKQIFIDIACYFVDNLKDTATRVWKASGWKAEYGLRVLEERCLVEEIDEDSVPVLRMHDHLRDLGRDLADEPSCHPPRRWRPQELENLESKGFENILKQEKRRCFHSFFDESLKSTVKFLFGGLNDAAATSTSLLLLQLDVDGYSSDSIPSWIPLQNIQCFTIYNGTFKILWRPDVPPPSQLRFLEISRTSLGEFPDCLGILTNVEGEVVGGEHSAIIEGRKSATLEVALSLLEDLVISEQDDIKKVAINGNHCPKLKSLELSCMNSLIEVMFSNCKELESLNCLKIIDCENLRRLSVTCDLTMLEELNISECPQLEEAGLNRLGYLRRITIVDCKLKSVPGISNFRKLVELNISNCPMLQGLSLADLRSLEKVVIEKCSTLSSVTGISNLRKLVELNISWCRKLQLELCLESLHFLKRIIVELSLKIKSFHLDGCQSLESVSGENADFRQIQMVNISACPDLKELPVICGASCLERIQINGCMKLSFLVLTDCRILKRLSGDFDLAKLAIKDCLMLQELPCFTNSARLKEIQILRCEKLQTITLPMTLKRLELNACGELKSLSGISTLKELVELDIRSCPSLYNLDVAHLGLLEKLRIANLNKLSGIRNLTKLVEMEISECMELELDLCLSGMSCLQEIAITESKKMQTITMPSSLTKLKLEACRELRTVRGLYSLTGLVELNIKKCPMLEGDFHLSGSNCLYSISVEHCNIRKITLPLTLRELKVHKCRKLQSFAGLETITELTEMYISECPELEEIPNLVRAKHFERIQIVSCGKLQNISLPKKLTKLTVQRCRRLRRIARMSDFMEATEPYISECAEVEELPVICGPSRVEKITIDRCAIFKEVSGTLDVFHLSQLWISDCPGLEELCIARLTCLEEIHILGCGKLKEMTSTTTLKVLHLDSCTELQSVSEISHLNNLVELIISQCCQLELMLHLEGMNSLRSIRIDRCGNLKSFLLKKCQNLRNVSVNFDMARLSIFDCPEFKELCLFPGLPRQLLETQTIHIGSCDKLKNITLPTNPMEHIQQGWGHWPSIERSVSDIAIYDCPELEELTNLCDMWNLERIIIISCERLRIIKLLKSSVELIVSRCRGLDRLEASSSYHAAIGIAMNLQHIDFSECPPNIEESRNLFGLGRLKSIRIECCEKLQSIAWIQNCLAIEEIEFIICSRTEIMQCIYEGEWRWSEYIQLVGKAGDGTTSKLKPCLVEEAEYCGDAASDVYEVKGSVSAIIVCGVIEGSSSAQHAINRENCEYHERSFEVGPGEWIITTVIPYINTRQHYLERTQRLEFFPRLVKSEWWQFVDYIPTAGEMKKCLAWAVRDNMRRTICDGLISLYQE